MKRRPDLVVEPVMASTPMRELDRTVQAVATKEVVITLIGEVLGQLKKRGNLAILLVEQYLDFATQLADHFFVMEKGAIVLQGKVSEIDQEAIKPYLAF